MSELTRKEAQALLLEALSKENKNNSVSGDNHAAVAAILYPDLKEGYKVKPYNIKCTDEIILGALSNRDVQSQIKELAQNIQLKMNYDIEHLGFKTVLPPSINSIKKQCEDNYKHNTKNASR